MQHADMPFTLAASCSMPALEGAGWLPAQSSWMSWSGKSAGKGNLPHPCTGSRGMRALYTGQSQRSPTLLPYYMPAGKFITVPTASQAASTMCIMYSDHAPLTIADTFIIWHCMLSNKLLLVEGSASRYGPQTLYNLFCTERLMLASTILCAMPLCNGHNSLSALNLPCRCAVRCPSHEPFGVP